MAKRDSKGRFIKGSIGNAKGNNQFTSIVPLIEALNKVGKKRKEDFWVMVARKAWTSDTVLVHILKKVLPDRKETVVDLKEAESVKDFVDVSKISAEEVSKLLSEELNK